MYLYIYHIILKMRYVNYFIFQAFFNENFFVIKMVWNPFPSTMKKHLSD